MKTLADISATCPRCSGPAFVEEFDAYRPGEAPKTKRIFRCQVARPNAEGGRCAPWVEIIEKEPTIMPLASSALMERYKRLPKDSRKGPRIAEITGIPKGTVTAVLGGFQPIKSEGMKKLEEGVAQLEGEVYENQVEPETCPGTETPPPPIDGIRSTSFERAAGLVESPPAPEPITVKINVTVDGEAQEPIVIPIAPMDTAQQLYDILSLHCGETGETEGLLDTVKRILSERDVNMVDEFPEAERLQAPPCLWECGKAVEQRMAEILNLLSSFGTFDKQTVLALASNRTGLLVSICSES